VITAIARDGQDQSLSQLHVRQRHISTAVNAFHCSRCGRGICVQSSQLSIAVGTYVGTAIGAAVGGLPAQKVRQGHVLSLQLKVQL